MILVKMSIVYRCRKNIDRSNGSMVIILISDACDYRHFYYFSFNNEY